MKLSQLKQAVYTKYSVTSTKELKKYQPNFDLRKPESWEQLLKDRILIVFTNNSGRYYTSYLNEMREMQEAVDQLREDAPAFFRNGFTAEIKPHLKAA